MGFAGLRFSTSHGSGMDKSVLIQTFFEDVKAQQ